MDSQTAIQAMDDVQAALDAVRRAMRQGDARKLERAWSALDEQVQGLGDVVGAMCTPFLVYADERDA